MRSELKRLDKWASSQFDTIPKTHRVIVTEHDALSSMATRYKVRYLPLMQSFASGGPLRPSSLGSIVQAAQSSGTKYLFSEKNLQLSGEFKVSEFPFIGLTVR